MKMSHCLERRDNMGAGLYWRQMSLQPKAEHFASGSRFHVALENCFGVFPITLTENDIPKLEGMVAAGLEDLTDLIHALGERGDLEITVEY